jgi:hypothetical protein
MTDRQKLAKLVDALVNSTYVDVTHLQAIDEPHPVDLLVEILPQFISRREALEFCRNSNAGIVHMIYDDYKQFFEPDPPAEAHAPIKHEELSLFEEEE